MEWRLIIHVRNRRIVFGRIDPQSTLMDRRLVVVDARCCIYYPENGDMGLANAVPDGVRHGPRVLAFEIDVEGSEVVTPTRAGVAAWSALRHEHDAPLSSEQS